MSEKPIGEEGPKDLVIPEEIVSNQDGQTGSQNTKKKQSVKSQSESKKSQALSNPKDLAIKDMIEAEQKSHSKYNLKSSHDSRHQDGSGNNFFQKKSKNKQGSSFYSNNNPITMIPEGEQKEYLKKLQEEEKKRFDFLMIRNMKLKVELKEASEVIDNLNKKERENLAKENEVEPESDEIKALNDILKDQQIYLNNVHNRNKTLKKTVDDYKNYNIEEKENDLYEMNRVVRNLEVERDSQLKVCQQQEKQFLIMKDDNLQQETKKKLQEQQVTLKQKVSKKKDKLVLQDLETRGNHGNLIEKKNINQRMKLLVERRTKKTQTHNSENNIIVDEEDLAVLNQQITSLETQRSDIELELDQDKMNLGTMLARLKIVNERLMLKFDQTGKEIKKNIIMLNEFKRFKKEEMIKKREKAKKDARQVEDDNFEVLKTRMRDEKIKRRKNPIYGGLDHLPPERKQYILNDGDTELITDRKAELELSGEYLFTASQDKHLKMWELKTGKLLYDYGEIDKEKVNAMTIDKNSNYLYTAGNYCIKKWDILTKEVIQEWDDLHTKQISTIVLTGDCEYLITGGYDERICKINLQTNEKELSYDSVQSGGIMTIAICNDLDNNYVYTSGPDGQVTKLQMEDFKKVSELYIFDEDNMSKKKNAHDDMVQAMVVAGDNKVLVTGGFDKKLKVWSIEDNKCLHEKIYAHTDFIISILVSTDSYEVFTGSADQKLKKWKLEYEESDNHSYKLVQVHSYGNVDCVYSMCFSHKDEFLFTGGQEKAVKQWSMKNDKLHRNFGYIHKSTITGLAVIAINLPDSEKEEEHVEEEAEEDVENEANQEGAENESNVNGENGEDTIEKVKEEEEEKSQKDTEKNKTKKKKA